MFERYTETARQTIVRAKHEADRFGSREVGVGHILLALLNDAALIRDTLEGVSEDELREAIGARLPRGETIPLPHDLPLSSESRQALISAAEEAEELGHRHVGNAHLLLGLMGCENSHAAELLRQKGLSADKLRTQIAEPKS
jgi:ATP-dependent Clp protease ATP-binding subunit ClpC